MGKLFKIDFSNSVIKDSAIEAFTAEAISNEVAKIKEPAPGSHTQTSF